MPSRRSHPIDERLEDVEQRLREVRRSLKSLARSGRPLPVSPPRQVGPAPGRAAVSGDPPPPRPAGPTMVPGDRHRFHRYFASASFPPGLPPKEERRLRRNKIVLIALASAFLAWILYRALAS